MAIEEEPDVNTSVDTQRLIQEFLTNHVGEDGGTGGGETKGRSGPTVGAAWQSGTAKRMEGLKDTQMSETIQFMAGAGQTGTSGLLPSYRSDVQDGQGPPA